MNVSNIIKVDDQSLKKEIGLISTDLICFVVDSEIQKEYPDFLKEIQQIEGKRVLSFVSASGENAKSFEEYQMDQIFLEKRIEMLT